MARISDVFGGTSLKALDDIPKEGRTLTISSVKMKDFDDGAKLIVGFQKLDKSLVCNRTNASIIAELYGDETDNWIGQKITLYATKVDFSGRRVDAIRVRDEIPVTVTGKPKTQPVTQADADAASDDVPY